jgi:hypothetical protein
MVTNISREFTVIRDIYKETKSGPRLVKKNVKTKMCIYLSEIYMVEEIVNNNGGTIKDRCGISIRDKGFVVVKEPYIKVNSDIFGTASKPKIGFNK